MTDRRSARRPPLIGLALLAGLALAPASARAWPEDRGLAPPRAPRIVRVRPDAVFVPPPVIVRDYLPRNHNIPMYNQPPRRDPVGGPAW